LAVKVIRHTIRHVEVPTSGSRDALLSGLLSPYDLPLNRGAGRLAAKNSRYILRHDIITDDAETRCRVHMFFHEYPFEGIGYLDGIPARLHATPFTPKYMILRCMML